VTTAVEHGVGILVVAHGARGGFLLGFLDELSNYVMLNRGDFWDNHILSRLNQIPTNMWYDIFFLLLNTILQPIPELANNVLIT
jgi:hypothetical protein